MKIEASILKQWKRLFEYYQDILIEPCKGASDKEIKAIELELEVIFPKEFSDSFKICNERYKFSNNDKGWFGIHDHYSLNKTYYDYYNFLEINKELRVYNEEWNKDFIVFYDYETWLSAVLNTKTGKVYCYENETGDYVLWANSYKEWLKIAVDEVVQYGELRLETIEKLLEIEN